MSFRPVTGRVLRAAGDPRGTNGTTDQAWLHRVAEACCELEPGQTDELPACDLVILLDEVARDFCRVPGRDIFEAFYRALSFWRDRGVFDLTPAELLFDLEQMRILTVRDQRRHR